MALLRSGADWLTGGGGGGVSADLSLMFQVLLWEAAVPGKSKSGGLLT